MTNILPLDSLATSRFDTPGILRKLAAASSQLAELKGIAASIPHQGILINTLGMCEVNAALCAIFTAGDETPARAS